MDATTVLPAGTDTTANSLATVFESTLGWMAVEFADRHVNRVTFGYSSLAQLLAAHSGPPLEPVDKVPHWIAELQSRLLRYAEGKPQEFGDVSIDTAHLTPFARNIVAECRRLAWGQTATYAEIARRAGRPGAARAVGNVMASNRFPLVVPCHRVTGAGGSLGGYSAPGGLATKRRLLEMEGVL